MPKPIGFVFTPKEWQEISLFIMRHSQDQQARAAQSCSYGLQPRNLSQPEGTRRMNHGIIYKGPSLLDGKPIVVIGTYSKRNSKTGAVLQTYILCDDGLDPLEASKTGADFSICGDCIMRGTPTTDPKRKQAEKRTCYVNLGQGVLIVYRSYIKGIYQPVPPRMLGYNRFVRVGTYGDPAAAPQEVWDRAAIRGQRLDRILAPVRVAPRHRHAVSQQPHRGSDALASRPSHLPRHRQPRRARPHQRGTLPSIQRGRPSRPMHKLQALQRLDPRQINRNRGALTCVTTKSATTSRAATTTASSSSSVATPIPTGVAQYATTARPNTVTRSAPKRKPSPQTTGHPDPPDGETGDYYHTAGASVPADPLARARVSDGLKGARFARTPL
jgi:hypothetical protein